MQVISIMALHNYKVPVIIIKKTSQSVLVNHEKTFQIFSRTYNQIQGLSRTFQDSKKIQDFSRMWQPCFRVRACASRPVYNSGRKRSIFQ